MTSVWTDALTTAWTTYFSAGAQPSFLVQTPGRVNLIGEHVDHQAYPVCPCAIRQSLGAAVSVEPKTGSNDALHLAHMNKTYAARAYKDASELRVESAKLYTNYICAAYFGIVEYYLNGKKPEEVGKLIDPKMGLTADQLKAASAHPHCPTNFSIRILLDGNIPPCAGLSSSAAVVVTTALALLRAGGEVPEMKVVADICAKAERYTGVASGGMDQAAELLSQEGSATLIHFKPLETATVCLPKGGAIVIANTCRQSPKAKMAAKMYNKRVFELKAGCLALLPKDEADKITAAGLLDLQLRDVVRVYLKSTEEKVLKDLESMLDQKIWNKADMTAVFNEERRDLLLKQLCGQDVWDKNDDFHVFHRVRHVLSEALRVEDFAKTAASSTLTDAEKLERLGQLMNGSGESLAKDFDCSSPEIEEVVAISRKHGAYGSRLTGAGWGGCVVSLVPDAKKDDIISAIKKEYFEPIYNKTRIMTPPLEDLPADMKMLETCVFATSPSQGATIYNL